MNSETIKACVAGYWRYRRQHNLVAFEMGPSLEPWSSTQADILSVTKDRYLVETEVKVSLSDLRRDGKKTNHQFYKRGNNHLPTAFFYFAVPREIANKACLICDDLYPYAGILGSDGTNELGVESYREAKRLNGSRLTPKLLIQMVRAQSATICRLAGKVEEQKRVIGNLSKKEVKR